MGVQLALPGSLWKEQQDRSQIEAKQLWWVLVKVQVLGPGMYLDCLLVECVVALVPVAPADDLSLYGVQLDLVELM